MPPNAEDPKIGHQDQVPFEFTPEVRALLDHMAVTLAEEFIQLMKDASKRDLERKK